MANFEGKHGLLLGALGISIIGNVDREAVSLRDVLCRVGRVLQNFVGGFLSILSFPGRTQNRFPIHAWVLVRGEIICQNMLD